MKVKNISILLCNHVLKKLLKSEVNRFSSFQKSWPPHSKRRIELRTFKVERRSKFFLLNTTLRIKDQTGPETATHFIT